MLPTTFQVVLAVFPKPTTIKGRLQRARWKGLLGRAAKGPAREIELELHLTHLNRRLHVGVVLDVGHELASM